MYIIIIKALALMQLYNWQNFEACVNADVYIKLSTTCINPFVHNF